MSERIDAERILDVYLAPEADRLPDRVIDAALADIARTQQRRALRVPWRFRFMPVLSRTTPMAALVLVAVVGAGGLIYLSSTSQGDPGGRPSPGPTPIPTSVPTPAPTPGASQVAPGITGWTEYTSNVYRWEPYVVDATLMFTVDYPEDWIVYAPATREWQAGDRLAVDAPYAERFASPEEAAVGLWVWRMPAGALADVGSWEGLEAWAETLCIDLRFSSCAGVPDETMPMCLSRRGGMRSGVYSVCYPALLVPLPEEQFAFFADPATGMVTVVVIGRENSHPSAARYGGAVELLKSILARMSVGTPEPGQVWATFGPPESPSN